MRLNGHRRTRPSSRSVISGRSLMESSGTSRYFDTSAGRRSAPALSSTLLVRTIYRTLLMGRRSYATYSSNTLTKVLDRLVVSNPAVIHDPMAGYGTLMTTCASRGISTISMDINPAMHLWEFLMNPENALRLRRVIATFREFLRKLRPPTMPRFAICDDWIPEATVPLVRALHSRLVVLSRRQFTASLSWIAALSVIFPILGRFSTYRELDISTHVRPGGIWIRSNWKGDVETVCNAIEARLARLPHRLLGSRHLVRLSDSRLAESFHEPVRAMVSSPPYPNREDYERLFAPELAWLSRLLTPRRARMLHPARRSIGTVYVRGKSPALPKSRIASRFLKLLGVASGRSRKMRTDFNSYYRPYYVQYFSDLAAVCTAIARRSGPSFHAFFIVTNNTSRGLVIPVAEFLVERWKLAGFRARIAKGMTTEKSHVGAKNPRARGYRSKHLEFVVEVTK